MTINSRLIAIEIIAPRKTLRGKKLLTTVELKERILVIPNSDVNLGK